MYSVIKKHVDSSGPFEEQFGRLFVA